MVSARRIALMASLALVAPALAQQNCPQGQMHAADGSCIPGTGAESGKPAGGTANVEAAKSGSAAPSTKMDAPEDKSKLGPNAVGPEGGDKTSGSDSGTASGQ